MTNETKERVLLPWIPEKFTDEDLITGLDLCESMVRFYAFHGKRLFQLDLKEGVELTKENLKKFMELPNTIRISEGLQPYKFVGQSFDSFAIRLLEVYAPEGFESFYEHFYEETEDLLGFPDEYLDLLWSTITTEP